MKRIKARIYYINQKTKTKTNFQHSVSGNVGLSQKSTARNVQYVSFLFEDW